MRLLVIQTAAMGWELLQRHGGAAARLPFPLEAAEPPFPAVTCTAQAVFRTGLAPEATGVICNGRFDPAGRRVDFWNQSARLVQGERIWQEARAAGCRVGLCFWQQSLGEAADLILSPAPIHRHHGGMIQDCYCRPRDLYARLCRDVGRPFNLRHYWGPMASFKASRWIADAMRCLLAMPETAPELLLTYLPHLDYALQKHGPDSPQAARALGETVDLLVELAAAASRAGYDILVWGDYAITPAIQPVQPNRHLLQAGFFEVRQVRRMTYPDLHASRAFAMVDHQVAHVYVAAPEDVPAVRSSLESLPGVAGIAVPDAPGAGGDLVLTAAPGAWFAYPWWEDRAAAPDYASHVDIHNKIGFDPCELFWGWPPPGVGQDPSRVKGTHGRSDAPVCVGTTLPRLRGAGSIRGLAARLREVLRDAPAR